jgi:phage virion morphogenesis protein
VENCSTNAKSGKGDPAAFVGNLPGPSPPQSTDHAYLGQKRGEFKMTGISVTAEIDDKAARFRLNAMMARMENPLGFHKEVGEYLHLSTNQNFQSETDPDGLPWQKLLPRTIRRRTKRKKAGLAILRETGVLKGSISTEPTAGQVIIGAAAPYAAIHQLGGTIKKPARKSVLFLKRNARTGEIGHRFVKRKKSNVVQDVTIPAHKITIPARPYIGIGADDVDSIVNIANTWLSDG